MADEIKETKEVVTEKSELTDEQTLEQVENEINDEMVKKVDEIINPPDEVVDEKKEKEEKSVDEAKEDKKEVTEEVKDDSDLVKEDDSKTTPTVADLNLPNRLLQAAKRNHVSDEEILKLGENAEMVLGKLADASDAVSERLGELGRKAKNEFQPSKKEDIKISTLNLPEDFDSEAGKQIQETISALTAKITNLERDIALKEQQSTSSSQIEQDKKIDTIFDVVGKTYPEFGNSSKLTNAELVMRQNVWEKADDIMAGGKLNGQKVSLEEALDQAMSIYEGKNPKKVREKLIEEVTKREKQQISRPTSKKQPDKALKGDKQAVKAVQEILDRCKEGW